MKIMFLVPPFHVCMHFVPVGVGIVATVAKDTGFDVSILLAEVGEDVFAYQKRVCKTIKDRSIDIVAIGGMSPHYWQIKQLIDLVKRLGVTTILGGIIVDASPEIVAEKIGADYCVYGEGEFTFIELLSALQNGKSTDDVSGLVFYRNGNLIKTSPRTCVPDLDALPFIDTELCHYSYSLCHNSELTVSLSRSCPYGCTFCSKLSGTYYRAKSLDYWFQELDYYLSKHVDKIKFLRIQDERLSTDKDRLIEFCQRMKHYDLSFTAQTRADYIDEECVVALKNAGAIRLNIGIESASNKILLSMKKGVQIEQITKALALGDKHGLEMGGHLIFGDVEDDADTIHESEKFFKRHRDKHVPRMYPIQVFPGTDLYRGAVEKGIIKDEVRYLEKGQFSINVSKLSDNEHAMFLDKYAGVAHDALMFRPLTAGKAGFSIDVSGNMNTMYACPSCYSQSTVTIRKKRQVEQKACSKCGHWMDPKMAKNIAPDHMDVYLFETFSDLYFRKYLGKRIVVWGITDITRKLLQSSQALRDMVVRVVDTNYQSMEDENYCGFKIESPLALGDFDFDHLLLAEIYSREKVTNFLNGKGINSPNFIEIFDFVNT